METRYLHGYQYIIPGCEQYFREEDEEFTAEDYRMLAEGRIEVLRIAAFALAVLSSDRVDLSDLVNE